jgi:large subunit ribosomal protein L25
MAKTYALAATTHATTGKGTARALRRSGRLPAVIYGGAAKPVTVSLDANTVNVEWRRGHMFTTLCALEIDGAAQQVLVRDVQLHPVRDDVIHVDFLRVTDRTTIAVPVPVQFVGEEECPGLRAKGTLSVRRHEVDILCRAADIPDFIEVNLAGKENGESINISDAALPPGTKPLIQDRDFTIATLIAPRRADDLDDEEAETSEAEEPQTQEPAE